MVRDFFVTLTQELIFTGFLIFLYALAITFAKLTTWISLDEYKKYNSAIAHLHTLLIVTFGIAYAYFITGAYTSNIIIAFSIAWLQKKGLKEHTGLFYALAIYYMQIELIFFSLICTYVSTLQNAQIKATKIDLFDIRSFTALLIILLLLLGLT